MYTVHCKCGLCVLKDMCLYCAQCDDLVDEYFPLVWGLVKSEFVSCVHLFCKLKLVRSIVSFCRTMGKSVI